MELKAGIDCVTKDCGHPRTHHTLMPKPGTCLIPTCPCKKYREIIAFDTYYETNKSKVLQGGGFANDAGAVQDHLEELIGLFDPTGYTLLDFDQGEEIPLHQYGDEYTWYRAKVSGKDTIIAAISN